MKKKIFLTESEKKSIILEREKAIINSFAKTFNKIKRIDENELKEYDNYNYPAGADADPNAPWNQDDRDYVPQYEYRNGELLVVNLLDNNYSGPIENQKLELHSKDDGICIVTMGQIFKELNVPQNIIEELKANDTTYQDYLEAREIHKETGEWPEQYTQKVDKYNDIFELITNKYGNEYAKYKHEIEPDITEDYDRGDYDDIDYDREYGGIDENALTENNESTVLMSTDKNDLKQDIAKLKKEKPDAKVGEITKNGKTFTVRITFNQTKKIQ